VARWRKSAPFPHPAHQTGRAVFPHPAFGQDLTLSHTRDYAVALPVSPGRHAHEKKPALGYRHWYVLCASCVATGGAYTARADRSVCKPDPQPRGCTGYKQKCPEPYTREEILEERFGDLLKGLYFDDEVLEWVSEASRQSHQDEKRHHDKAIKRLQTEYQKLQSRIDAMYDDKLDGRIDASFFDRKAAEWRSEQNRIQVAIEDHQSANQTYFDEGIKILELAQSAYRLYLKQKPQEKRRLLNFLLSNCTWKGGELHAEFRQPFDLLADTVTVYENKKAEGIASDQLFDIWRGGRDSNFKAW